MTTQSQEETGAHKKKIRAEIIRLQTAGLSYADIMENFNERGLKTMRGKRWTEENLKWVAKDRYSHSKAESASSTHSKTAKHPMTDPDTFRIIAHMRDHDRKSFDQIAQYFNKIGRKTARGVLWNAINVRKKYRAFKARTSRMNTVNSALKASVKKKSSGATDMEMMVNTLRESIQERVSGLFDYFQQMGVIIHEISRSPDGSFTVRKTMTFTDTFSKK